MKNVSQSNTKNQVMVAERAKVSLEHELEFKKHISDEIISADLKMLPIYEWLNQCLDADSVRDG